MNDEIKREKRKLCISLSILLGTLIIYALLYFSLEESRDLQKVVNQIEYNYYLNMLYRIQNRTLCSVEPGAFPNTFFVPESKVEEGRLYLRIYLYQKENEEDDFTINDVYMYLSSEYNQDGTLRILNQPQNIEEFKAFCDGAPVLIDTFYNDISVLVQNFEQEHPELKLVDLSIMPCDQVQEFINKYEDPNYEIKLDIFK